LDPSRKDFIAKRKEVAAKLNSFREDFKKKEKEAKADLEKASRMWKKVGERFRWWQSLP